MRLLVIILLLLSAFICQMCVNHDLMSKANCSQSGLTLSVDSIVGATSCSTADGKIYTSAKGGQAPYEFIINADAAQASAAFEDQPSGIYTVTVRDRNGCESSIDNITLPARDFQFSAVVTEDNDCVNHNGAIVIAVKAGTPPFAYKLNDGAFSDLNSFTGLKTAQYNVTIKDAIDCTVRLSITVPRGNTSTSWSNDILPIMKTSCALNGCHDGKTRFNYKDYQTAKRDALLIKSRTQDKSMPFDGSPLPQSQIDLIACWVDDGAQDN